MPPSKQKMGIVEERRDRVAYYYCSGFSMMAICKQVGTNPATVADDLKAIREVWKERYTRQYGERLDEELAKIDLIEQEAWKAWEKSSQDEIYLTHRIEMVPQFEKPEKGTGTKGKIKKAPLVTLKEVKDEKRKAQVGNPAFLDKVAWCIETRLKVMGALTEVDKRSQNVQKSVMDWESLYGRVEVIDPVEARIAAEEAQITHTPVVISHNNTNGTNGNGKH